MIEFGDIINVITMIGSFIALIFSMITFFTVKKREIRKDTVDAYRQLQEDLHFIYQYKKGEIETFVTDRTSEEYKALSTCLAKIEFFSTGIKTRVYDYKTTYSLAHGFLDMTLKTKIKYLIDYKNEIAEEKFYINTTWLLNKMDEDSRK